MCDIGGCFGGMSLGGFLASMGLGLLGLILLGFLALNLIGLVAVIKRFRFNLLNAFTPRPPKQRQAEVDKTSSETDSKGSHGFWGPLLVLVVGASLIGALVALTIALANGGL